MKMTSHKVKIGLVQMACSDDPKRNLEKAIQRIGEAARRGAKIVCLQELFRTPYFCQVESSKLFDLAEPVPGPTTEALAKVARAKKVVIIASLFEKRAKGVYYNTAAVLDADGKFLGKYRKMHIPDDPGFHEKFYFVPGDLGFQVFDTRYAKIAVLVCWDQWFPEAARLAALAGADILFYPTAIGWDPSDPKEAARYREAWTTIQRSHAIANGVFVAAVNRVGLEKAAGRSPMKFWGQSFVAEPFGEMAVKGGDTETVLIAECDLAKVEQTRREWPFLRDRRVDAYAPILSRFIEKK